MNWYKKSITLKRPNFEEDSDIGSKIPSSEAIIEKEYQVYITIANHRLSPAVDETILTAEDFAIESEILAVAKKYRLRVESITTDDVEIQYDVSECTFYKTLKVKAYSDHDLFDFENEVVKKSSFLRLNLINSIVQEHIISLTFEMN